MVDPIIELISRDEEENAVIFSEPVETKPFPCGNAEPITKSNKFVVKQSGIMEMNWTSPGAKSNLQKLHNKHRRRHQETKSVD